MKAGSVGARGLLSGAAVADEKESVQQEEVMDTVKEILLTELKNLKAEEFEEFKYLLQEYGSKAKTALSKDESYLKIAPCDLENANRRKTVDLIVQTYSSQPVFVTQEVLSKVGRNDLVERLSQSSTRETNMM